MTSDPASPCEARFPEIVQLVRVGEDFSLQCTPPPDPAPVPEIVQPVRVGEAFRQYTPPPLPPEVIHNTRARYVQALQVLTGEGL